MNYISRKTPITRTDNAWIEKAKKWREVKLQLEKLKEEEETLRQELIQLSDEAEETAGGGIRLSKSIRKGLVDYQNIPELENVDLEKYRKPPSVSFRILILEKL